MYCPKCGNENKEDALFCNECGASLKLKEQRYCPHCNNENSSNAKFCDKCGFSLEISKFQESQEKPGEKIVEKIGELKKANEFNSPETLTENGIEFVLIPSGEFIMGSPDEEKNRFPSEGPAHKVTIKKPFYLSKFPITQKQWKTVMGDNPSHYKGDDLPVEMISWENAQEFIKKLNEMEGTVKYRLPSEAEWEYACRAGTQTRYSFGDDDSKLEEYTWYTKDSDHNTHPVGQKRPNHWGLYDMHGNVYEWVQDSYHLDYNGAPSDGSAWEDRPHRVLRGSNSSSLLHSFYSAYRSDNDKIGNFLSGGCLIGFRILREDFKGSVLKTINEPAPEPIAMKTITEMTPKAITESASQVSTEAAPKAIIQKEPKEITKTAPKRITLSGVIRYFFGIVYLLIGLMYLVQGKVISSGLAFLIVIVLMPPKANSVEGKYNYSISGPLRFVIVLVLAMLVGLFSF